MEASDIAVSGREVALHIRASEAYVHDVTVAAKGSVAVLFSGLGSSSLTSCVVRGNVCVNLEKGNARLERVSTADGVFEGLGGSFALVGCEGSVIAHDQTEVNAKDCVLGSVSLLTGASGQIQGSLIARGLSAYEGTRLELRGNRIRDEDGKKLPTWHCVVIQGPRTTANLIGNVVEPTKEAGVAVDRGADAKLTENTFLFLRYDGPLLTTGSTRERLAEDNIFGIRVSGKDTRVQYRGNRFESRVGATAVGLFKDAKDMDEGNNTYEGVVKEKRRFQD